MGYANIRVHYTSNFQTLEIEGVFLVELFHSTEAINIHVEVMFGGN